MFIPFGFMAGEPAAGGSFLLDTYGSATVAYSLRKLSSSSTNAIEVRRSSDNTTQDIGFVGEDLDTSALTTFTGAGEGYISKWYDQSGNSNDAIQSTTSAQPLIVSGGTVESVNSKSAINFNGTTDYFDLTSAVATQGTSAAFAYVLNRATTSIKQATLGTTTNTPYGPYWFSDNNVYYAPQTSGGSGRPSGATGQNLVFLDAPASPFSLYINGTQITAGGGGFGGTASTYTYFGRRAGEYTNGKHQEFILWDSNESANRVGIESNINTYYSIYP